MGALNSDILKFFADLIEKESGIQYNSVNSHLLENRLNELAKVMGFGSVDEFWNDVKGRGLRANEREMVLDLATNNETSFFRDPEIFEFFKNEFIVKFTKAEQHIKIWCAATSTGQEPYTLAMCLSQLKDAGIQRRYDLLATDISERVLEQAKKGIYSQLEVQRGLSAQLLVRYFTQVVLENSAQEKFKIKPDLQQHIMFRRQNLLDPWPQNARYDIIFCRNVLIYQNLENKKRIIARFAKTLAPGGFLVLGGAESLLGLSGEFEMQLFGKACVYKLKESLKESA